MEIIQNEVDNTGHSWDFARIVKFNGHRLRVRIRRDAYDFQSFALVERWSGEKWHEVVRQSIDFCRCQSVSHVQKGITSEAFEHDSKRLLEMAKAVVL